MPFKDYIMITNYLKIAIRHLWQHKLYSFINVIGLAMAITCVLLAVFYIKNESGYDNFHRNGPDLYRILTHSFNPDGQPRTVAATGQPQGPAFKAAVPEIRDYARLLGGDIRGDVIANNKTLSLQMLFTDESFFRVFSFPLVRGSANTALDDIASAVITESVALKYFNTIDVVGKTLQPDANPSDHKLGRPLVITGVARDIPKNSSIRFDILLSMRYMQLSFTDHAWLNQYLGTFVLLQPGADPERVSKKFDQVFAIHAKKQVDESKRLFNHDPRITYGLQPVREMHLHPYPSGSGWREGGIVNESNPVFSWIFLGIAAFILFMAAVNFINITIAGSLKRSKEVGVRKIAGGSRFQIIFQFLLESVIICLVAFALSLLLTQVSLPLFNSLTGKQVMFHESLDAAMLWWLSLILLAIVILSGFYPAYVLSAFRPREVLYNRQRPGGRNLLGRSLVVVQFSLAVFFILATVIYYRQMDFIRTRDLGYDPYQVVRTHIRGDRDVTIVKQLLKNEWGSEPSIEYISFGSQGSLYEVKIGDKKVEALHEVIDEYRIPAMQLTLNAGRNLSGSIASDRHHAVIVNESFVRAAGLESPLGTQMYTSDRYDKELKTIVGVIKDFHSGPLHEKIKPMVMLACDWDAGGIWIRISKQNRQRALRAIEAGYKKAMPTALYEYHFLDDLNAQAYEQEQRWQRVIAVAAALSIIICCLGLFGLAHLAAQRRVKEIGIRKILGASVAGITALLSRDFLQLVALSLLIASPLAWWVMNNWLQGFAYRISIGWWVFMLAGLVAILIAAATVSVQAIRAAVASPVKSLRTE